MIIFIDLFFLVSFNMYVCACMIACMRARLK